MTERISPRRFHEAVGVEDWRVLFEGACAHCRTASSWFAASASVGPPALPRTITPLSTCGTRARRLRQLRDAEDRDHGQVADNQHPHV